MKEHAKVLRWEEPPPAKRGAVTSSSRFDALAEELRAQPGRWAVIYDGTTKSFSGMAHHIRQGAIRCFAPAGDFDATYRASADGVRVYARYVGDRDGEPDV